MKKGGEFAARLLRQLAGLFQDFAKALIIAASTSFCDGSIGFVGAVLRMARLFRCSFLCSPHVCHTQFQGS